MTDVTPHVGRHTFAQTLRNLGKDKAAMAEMLDWTDENMANRYSVVPEEEQTQILDDVGEAFRGGGVKRLKRKATRSEEHTSELQSLMRSSYAVFCLKKKTKTNKQKET